MSKEYVSFTANILKEYILKISFIEFPFLNLPIIKQVYSFIITRIIAKLEIEGKLYIDFKKIDNEVSIQDNEYNQAIKNLKEVLNSNKTEEEKNEYLQEAKKRLRDLIRMSSR